MSDISKIFIAIASEFTGKPAFDKAGSATTKLQKSVLGLAKSLGIAFSVGAVVAYGKAAVKAASEDARAQALLATQLKNVGYQMADIGVEQFIGNMEKTSGILDDQLRPAFSKLLVATGSVAKSQQLMNVVYDTAAARTLDVGTVANALSMAWGGNVKGLKALGLVYSKTELKTLTFAKIEKDLISLYKGAGKASAETFAGAMDRLNVAAKNAQETIGYALIGSLDKLGKNEAINVQIGLMEDFSQAIADTITGYGFLVGKMSMGLPDVKPPSWLTAFVVGGLPALAGNALNNKKDPFRMQSPAERKKIDIENAKIEKDRIRVEKLMQKALVDNTKALKVKTKGELALDALNKMFDPQNAELSAAMAAATDQETKARLLALMAINNNDSAMAQLAINALSASDSLKVFRDATLEAIKALIALVQSQIAKLNASLGIGDWSSWSNDPNAVQGGLAGAVADSFMTSGAGSVSGWRSAEGFQSSLGNTVNISVQGSITTDRDLVSMVTNALYNNQASGIPVNYSTSY